VPDGVSAREKLEQLEEAQRATLNILEDFDAEKQRLGEAQPAGLKGPLIMPTIGVLESQRGRQLTGQLLCGMRNHALAERKPPRLERECQ